MPKHHNINLKSHQIPRTRYFSINTEIIYLFDPVMINFCDVRFPPCFQIKNIHPICPRTLFGVKVLCNKRILEIEVCPEVFGHDSTAPLTFPSKSISQSPERSCWITTSSSKNTTFFSSGNSCISSKKNY